MAEPTRAELRAAGEELLLGYGAVADAKDIPAALELFRDATVRFPHTTAHGASGLAELYAGLWSKPNPHRHIITNIRIADEGGRYSARALYTRWEFAPEPTMTTMGEYEMHFSLHDARWSVDELIVTRTWAA